MIHRDSVNSRKKFKPKVIKWLIFIILIALILLFAPNFREYLYPMDYQEEVFKYSDEQGLDPLLVFAVIKCESNFNAGANSRAGAVGLMQLMPSTAEWVAGKSNVEYDISKLNEPDYNIMMGTLYLEYLFDYWDQDLPKVLASYNGGFANVRSWLADGIWDGTTANLDNIPFAETRNYLKRTISAYKTYRELYGSKIKQ